MTRKVPRPMIWCGLLAVLMFGVAAQATDVSGPYYDNTTGGDWRGTYGDCFQMVPQPEQDRVEEPVGPGWYSEAMGQYAFNNCYSGALFDAGAIDWRIHDGEGNEAFAWKDEADAPPESGQVWNECLGQRYFGVWDNHRFVWDPLTLEVTLTVGGDLTIAYFFSDEINVCRELDFDFFVDGVLEGSGTVGDLMTGKYIYFDLTGVPDTGVTLRLEVFDAPGDPVCSEPKDQDGLNSLIGGVFINGTTVCEEPYCGDGVVDTDLGETCDPPGEPAGEPNECREDCTFCGDGILDPGEECDDGNNVGGDGCSPYCEDEFGGQGCTPGYWKVDQHLDSWVGYAPGDSYNAVFGVADPDNPTLLEAMWRGGGGYKALGRHAVAGLLNASSPDVDYAYTEAQVILIVQGAFATGDYEGAKDMLEAENGDMTPCPLN